MADEKLKELDAIRCGNRKLEEQLCHLENYERIGDARDKIKIDKLSKRLESHKRAVQHELDHPPFVAPKIVQPELPQLPPPRGEYIPFEFCIIQSNTLSFLRNCADIHLENSKHLLIAL